MGTVFQPPHSAGAEGTRRARMPAQRRTMPLTFHRVEVAAPAALLWELLKDKIEHPDRFLPGVQQVEVRRRLGERSIERVMHLRAGAAEKVIHEIISWDEPTLTVVFKLAGDPVYTGFVTNTIFEEDGKVVLDFTMNWTPRHPTAPQQEPDWAASIRGAVLHTKELAEQRAGSQST